MHGGQCMPCSIKFSLTSQTEILSTETADFLEQIVFLKSFNSVFSVKEDFQLYQYFIKYGVPLPYNNYVYIQIFYIQTSP